MSALGQPVLGPSKIRELQQRFLGEETVAEVLFVFYKLLTPLGVPRTALVSK